MEIWFCELLRYLEYLCLLLPFTVAGDRLVLCECTYGLGKKKKKTDFALKLSGYSGRGEPPPPPRVRHYGFCVTRLFSSQLRQELGRRGAQRSG